MKIPNVRFFQNEEDVVNYVKGFSIHECDVSCDQEDALLKEMVIHWAKKEDVNRAREMFDCIKSSSKYLSFPYFKLCKLRDDGSFSKPLNACIINDQIYILSKREKDIYTKAELFPIM